MHNNVIFMTCRAYTNLKLWSYFVTCSSKHSLGVLKSQERMVTQAQNAVSCGFIKPELCWQCTDSFKDSTGWTHPSYCPFMHDTSGLHTVTLSTKASAYFQSKCGQTATNSHAKPPGNLPFLNQWCEKEALVTEVYQLLFKCCFVAGIRLTSSSCV
jgi:hypothetical protein